LGEQQHNPDRVVFLRKALHVLNLELPSPLVRSCCQNDIHAIQQIRHMIRCGRNLASRCRWTASLQGLVGDESKKWLLDPILAELRSVHLPGREA
jgi:hypothetical protein